MIVLPADVHEGAKNVHQFLIKTYKCFLLLLIVLFPVNGWQ